MFRSRIVNIYKKAEIFFEKNSETSVQVQYNMFYCPGMLENILYTFSQLVVWTNVMQSLFKSPNTVATSSDIEEYFKDLRISINSIRKPNKFILSHVYDIKGDILRSSKGFLQKINENKQPDSEINNNKNFTSSKANKNNDMCNNYIYVNFSIFKINFKYYFQVNLLEIMKIKIS